jgi:hypothetical protein
VNLSTSDKLRCRLVTNTIRHALETVDTITDEDLKADILAAITLAIAGYAYHNGLGSKVVRNLDLIEGLSDN